MFLSLNDSVNKIYESVFSVKDRKDLLNLVHEFLAKAISIKFVWIGLSDDLSERVVPVTVLNNISGDFQHFVQRANIAVNSSRPLLIKDINDEEIFEYWKEEAVNNNFVSSVLLPLTDGINNKVYGCIELYSDSKNVFTDKELDMLTKMANNITYCIKTIESIKSMDTKYTNMENLIEQTFKSVALMIETKDPYKIGHHNNVSRIGVAIATKMGLSDEGLRNVYIAGLLHDIGKVFIPRELLNKPEKLDSKEHDLIKPHAKLGYEVLKNIDFPGPIAQIVLQHHERLDGSGYPYGLTGDDILMEAKIIGVSDVIDSMLSNRIYRSALKKEQVISEIVFNRGKLYDKKIVNVCLKLFNHGEIDHIRNNVSYPMLSSDMLNTKISVYR